MALLKEIVPADLHDRPYLKDLLDKEQNPETFGAVFKKLDGAETLIGKRPGVPAKDAKDEEWDKFLSALKPEKADDYEVPVKEGTKPDVEFIKELKDAFLAGDISKRQASKFLAKFTGSIEKRTAAAFEAQKKADADFETLAKAAFGEQNKEVMARVNAAIKDHAPAVVKPYIDKLDNNALAIMAGVIDGILKKYATEDDLDPKNNGNEGDKGESLQQQARALMQSKEYSDAFHPDHEKVVAKVQQMYKEISAARGK